MVDAQPGVLARHCAGRVEEAVGASIAAIQLQPRKPPQNTVRNSILMTGTS